MKTKPSEPTQPVRYPTLWYRAQTRAGKPLLRSVEPALAKRMVTHMARLVLLMSDRECLALNRSIRGLSTRVSLEDTMPAVEALVARAKGWA